MRAAGAGELTGGGWGGYTSSGVTHAPDGDVLAATDSVNGQWQYEYGPLNRLLEACDPNCSSPATALQYVYDHFGNRWEENALAGGGPSPQLTFDDNNHIVGGSYDASGDLLAQGSNTFTYDAEGRIASATVGGGDVQYVYDAFGHRVEKVTSAGTFYYLHDLSGRPVTELSSSGGFNRGEVYSSGRHLATYANNTTIFDYADWLGTERMRATVTGYEQEACASLPYGANLSCTGGTDYSPKHFTGQVRDAATSLDHFPARYYTSSWGGWLTPDPLGGHLGNPQTLDKYVYVADNPISLTDPSGQDFYLTCQHTDKNGSTCQQETVGHDKSGKAESAWVQGTTSHGRFTATLIGNGADGGLVDLTTGTGVYTGSVNGSGVQLSNNGGGTSSTGVFVNGTPATKFQDAGWANGGALDEFTYTFTNSKLEANQTAAGTFTFAGTRAAAEAALEAAGFASRWGTEGGDEFRSSGEPWTGADSGHFIVDPAATLPASGREHFGEHNPFGGLGIGWFSVGGALHCLSDGAGLC